MLPLALDRGRRPLLLAHRGACVERPENTAEAFRLALERGADGVELDVRLCASGEPVVVHDADLSRIAGQPVRIARAPWSVLRGLDVGSWFHPRFSGARLLTLPEALEVLGPTAIVNVELKGDGEPSLAEIVARSLAGAPAPERFLVSSFQPLLLARFRARLSGCPRGRRPSIGLLFESEKAPAVGWALAGRALGAASLHPARELCRGRRVRRWTRAGFAVVPWTVDDPAAALALWEAGARGFITNRPGDLAGLWGSR